MFDTKLATWHASAFGNLLSPFPYSTNLLDSHASFFIFSAINVESVHQAERKFRTKLAWGEIRYDSRTFRDLDQSARTTANHCLEHHRVSSKPQTPSTSIYYLKLHTAALFCSLIHMLAVVTHKVLACFPQ